MNKELIIRIDEMTNGEFSRRFIQPETPNGVFVEFTKPDLSMVGARKPGWFRKRPIRVNGEAEGGGMEGRKLLQLRISESMLGGIGSFKPAPFGRTFLSPPNPDFDGDALDAMFEAHVRKEKAKFLRGLLRSKTKRGPKRRYGGLRVRRNSFGEN